MNEKAKALLEKYQSGQCTSEEKALVEQWYYQWHYQVGDPEGDVDFEALYREHLLYIKRRTKYNGHLLRYWWLYASAVLLIAGVSVFFFHVSNPKGLKRPIALTDQIGPGTNKAILRVAGGNPISLDTAQGSIKMGEESIRYNNDSIVPGATISRNSPITTNILMTPKGGQYQVVLADGTKVWLNAASTLRYPSKFGENNREVELEGEAYFLVTKAQNSPFIVKCKNQEIRVLGTEFNVFSFSDETESKTTLVNGKVEVTVNRPKSGSDAVLSEILNPGEQSAVNGLKLTKTKVDLRMAISWKRGWFYFDKTPVDELMRQVSRWYDVDVLYENGIPMASFSGYIKRNISLNTLLELLGDSALDFTLEGRKLRISAKKEKL